MALVSRFEGIIFDYGGVLARHQTDQDQAQLAKIAGIPKDLFCSLYWADRLEYDKGALSAAEYWQKVASGGDTAFNQDVINQLVELDTTSWMQFDPPMWDWIAQLRNSGKRVAMLSNMPRELGEALKSRTGRLNGFDHVTLSYEIHAAKPEPAAYEHCLEGLGTGPEQTLFFDDRIANIEAAELLGIRAIQFLDRDDVLLRCRVE